MFYFQAISAATEGSNLYIKFIGARKAFLVILFHIPKIPYYFL